MHIAIGHLLHGIQLKGPKVVSVCNPKEPTNCRTKQQNWLCVLIRLWLQGKYWHWKVATFMFWTAFPNCNRSRIQLYWRWNAIYSGIRWFWALCRLSYKNLHWYFQISTVLVGRNHSVRLHFCNGPQVSSGHWVLEANLHFMLYT